MAAACAAVCVLFVAGCGGGGGGSSASKGASISLATNSVAVTAAYGDPAPTRTVRLTGINMPAEPLYIGTSFSGEALAWTDFNAISDTEADIVLQLRDPVELEVGTATSSVEVRVCYDAQC